MLNPTTWLIIEWTLLGTWFVVCLGALYLAWVYAGGAVEVKDREESDKC